MQVVKYLHHSDLLLQGEQGMAVISGGHYVLSLGDKVHLKQILDENKKLYLVEVSFASNQHSTRCEDEWMLKFEGSQEAINQYLSMTTVH